MKYIFSRIWTIPFCICLITGCGPKTPAADTKPSALVLSDEMLDSIVVDTVRYLPVRGEVSLTGKVTADGNKILKVYPTLSGYAEDVEVQLGDYVHKGQLLAVIHSGEIAGYQKQLSDANSNLTVAKKKLQVEQDLYNSRLSTQKDVTDAQSEVQKAEAERSQLNDLFSIYRKGSGSTYKIIAPISGYIIEKGINNGMELRNDNNESVFTISEIDDVWVMANVFESDIPKIKEGDSADVSAISYPDKVFRGRVDKIYNFLDPTTKTMQLRIRINNKEKLLKPEMFASVNIYYPGNDHMLAIPSSALIFDNNAYYVLVMHSKTDIKIKEVLPFQTSGNLTYVKKGLEDGTPLISKNQLLIYNALLQQ